MEDKYNNNLGDFFRKKFSEKDIPDDDWGRPDENIRENLLEKIAAPASPTPAHYSSNLFWKIAFIIALFLAGGYIYYLHQKNSEIKNILQAQSEQLKKVETGLSNQKNKFIEETSTLLIANKKIEEEKKELLAQNKNLTQRVYQKKSSASQILNENKKLKKEIETLSTTIEKLKNTQAEKAEIEVAEANKNVEQISALSIIQKIYPIALNQYLSQNIEKEEKNNTEEIVEINETPEPELIEKIDPIKTPQKRYEFGYEYSSTDFEIPVERKFAQQRSANQSVQNNKVNIDFHGATFAYSPRNNWWIRTGLRMASFDLEREYNIALDYDKENEIDRHGFGTSNRLLLTTSTPYTTTRSSFEVTFDQGEELEDGDLLELAITDVQKMSYIQVPLGLEYHFGTEKLKGIIQGGIQWNRVAIEEYEFTVFSKAKEREIPVERKRVIARDNPSDKFMSAYVGLGMDYQFFHNFHARASFNLIRDLNRNNNRTNRFPNSPETGTAFRLGLNYRF